LDSPVVDLDPVLGLMTSGNVFADRRPVRRRFHQMLDALERTGSRYAVCGAVALGAHRAERLTVDIDILIAAEDIDRLVGSLGRTMREVARLPADGPPKQIKLRSRRAKDNTGVDVDLLVPIDVVEAWALATAVRARAHGRNVDVVSAEALVVMKLNAFLSDPEGNGPKHRWDVTRLLATGSVDLEPLRHFLSDHADLAAELERVLAQPPPRERVR
jgi:hypothetical protein